MKPALERLQNEAVEEQTGASMEREGYVAGDSTGVHGAGGWSRYYQKADLNAGNDVPL